MKLGDITRESRETFKGDKTGIPIVGLEHLIPQELTFSTYDVDTDNTFTKMFHKGQILFGRRRAYLKKAAVAEFDGICSGDITVIEAIPGKVDKDLLPYIIQNDALFDYAVSRSAGGLSPRVKWEQLSDYEINLPPLEEQKVLADKLWAAYRLKEGYKKLLCATDEMVKSQFIEMLFKKPITGKIGDLVDKKIFSVKKIHSMNDIIEYIDISSVERSNHSIVETTSYVVSNAPSRAQQCVRLDDILVSTVRPINRNIAVVNSDKNNLVASTGFCVLRPKLAFKEYLLAIVQSDKYTEAMIDKASGGLYPAVNNGDVLNYGIYIPDEEFAKKFSLIYQQADKSKFELKQCIENIDKVIKSLING